jgi:RNA polymerase sigma-70 factor, ECF subfamily
VSSDMDAASGEAHVDVRALFDAAYEQHWKAVFRFALAWTNDIGEAEQVAQDAFARLWQGRTRFDWSSPVRPWLLQAARRLCIDRFRRLRLQFRRLPRPATLDPSVADEWLDVQAAFATLTPVERTAITLVVIEGFTTDEVGGLLGTSPGAVRAAISRARQKLESR